MTSADRALALAGGLIGGTLTLLIAWHLAWHQRKARP